MTPETWTIIGVGIAIAALILNAQRSARADIRDLSARMGQMEQRMGQLEQRMARLEGLFEGFTGRRGGERPAA